MTSFLKSLAIFVAVLAVLLVAVSKTTGFVNTTTWAIFGYFTLFTIGFHYGLVKASKGKPQQFIRYYMGATFFKLLIHLGVLIIYSLFHRDEAVKFIASFALMYLAFTIFEFVAMQKSFKKA